MHNDNDSNYNEVDKTWQTKIKVLLKYYRKQNTYKSNWVYYHDSKTFTQATTYVYKCASVLIIMLYY